MKIIILFSLYAFICFFINCPLYVSTFAVILATPILAFFLKSFLSSFQILYLVSSLVLISVLYFVCGIRKEKSRSARDLAPFLIFIATFIVSYHLTLSWPDFFPMGERMRDYALLASVHTTPFEAHEPWMSGASLNYYIYWYRFAHFISTFTGYAVWDTYHVMAGFSPAFLAASISFLLIQCFSFTIFYTVLSSIIIVFGSNIAGIKNFFYGDQGWWGPSRVIRGAINEFPAWSFLLGDLHPHFLNLGLPPFLVGLLWTLCVAETSRALRIVGLIALFVISPFLIFNANAWDVPMLGVVFGVAIILFFFYGFQKQFKDIPLQSLAHEKYIVASLTALLLVFSLYSSSRNILPGDTPIHFVSKYVPGASPGTFVYIPSTDLAGTFLHWGIPLVLISLGAIMTPISWLERLVVALLIAASLFFSESKILLFLVLTIYALSYLRKAQIEGDEQSLSTWLHRTIILASLTLLLIPEAIFLDDAYGGENERMNTIFKVYSFSWSFIWIAGFLELRQLIKRLPLNIPALPKAVVSLVFTFILCGFTFSTIKLRKSQDSDPQGLASVEKEFPGAKAVIQKLRDLPESTIILEAQGNPYSWTSHISSLAGKTSFLGWANHVGLLTKKHEEVGRREKVTQQIYTSQSCEERKQLASQEGITTIVVGPLEESKYGPGVRVNWDCFKVIVFLEGGYSVFG
jgi:uncharacterized membrane protein